jgi:chlorobactene glucosyltransferase
MAAILNCGLLGISLMGLCIWISRYLALLQLDRREPHLNENSYTRPLAAPPRVSILIPARNEEKNIWECLESLGQQDYPNCEIIVVNDRSTDSTAEIVREFQKSHKNVTLIHNAELQECWSSKNFALHRGIQSAKGSWYLFTDADTRHNPKCLSQAVNYVLDKKVDMLSLLPSLETKSFWEKLVQPQAAAALFLSFPIKNSNNPRKKTAIANGQFILISKEAYRKFGGHEGLREHLLEDVAMAKAVKHGGDVLNLVIGPDLYRTRMYKNFREIWNGWTRIFYYIYDKRFWLILANIAIHFVFSLLPIVIFVYSGVALAMKKGLPNRAFPLFVVSALQILVIRLTAFLYCRVSRSNTFYSLLSPIGFAIVIGILLNAIRTIFSKKGITWRGTTYPKELKGFIDERSLE